ncbi:hypothetical protein N8T08_002348 [Aspergillus melleus]|uniref:Uncharacterized protein n=1 Tax=Aspergillus melleus TaxID=138277 RepID=A0ACC3B943_9EURO|nr:hypothetical protein N8T08_002348 [Aspergillus melleus]
MSSDTIPDRYKLVFFVPHSHLDTVKDAVFATGAGTFPGGKYVKCCFQMPGQGQFMPAGGANPAIGAVGTLEYVEEMKVEVMCLGRSIMLHAVEALVKAHPATDHRPDRCFADRLSLLAPQQAHQQPDHPLPVLRAEPQTRR